MALYGVSFLVCSLLLLQFFYLVHFAKDQNIFQKKILVFADLFCSPVLLIIYFCCIDKLSQFDDFTLPDRNYCHFTCVYFFCKNFIFVYTDGSSTSTAQALWMADSIFSKHSRTNATRVMLLATDGWSHNELQLPFGVLWPAARLRKLHGKDSLS